MTTSRRMWTTWRTWSTWRPSAAPVCASAWIRSAAPASTTGNRSSRSTASRSTVVNDAVDPTFRFMTVDWDGQIRTDCSSPYAMVPLVDLMARRDRFDVAFANDADHDRHGIVTPSAGLMNPNHYLAVAISYLFQHRRQWSTGRRGRQDRGQQQHDRPRHGGAGTPPHRSPGRVQVVRRTGCSTGRSASAARRARARRSCASTARPGPRTRTASCSGLLAAEITATLGIDPGARYLELTREFGTPVYERIDAPATVDQKRLLATLSAASVDAKELAGDPIRSIITSAPGNGESIGGLKVITDEGWFAVRPSGTEEVYKLYAESFRDRAHLERIQTEAQALVTRLFPQVSA